jgi:hypothetical protein
MESIELLLEAAALVGLGCAATILSAHVYPLWLRVRGQAHGRFAGLAATEPSFEPDSKPKAGGLGRRIAERPAPNLIVA